MIDCEKHVLHDNTEGPLRFHVGRNIVLNVQLSSEPRERDSARANSKILADYKWANKSDYQGRILATRGKWKFVAYRIFHETTGEAVRILERELKGRHLIKDFRKPIADIQWAYNGPYLAVVDQNANLYIYSVEESENSISKFLNVIRNEAQINSLGDIPSQFHPKVSWCPYVSDEPESKNERLMLAVTQGKSIDIFMLDKILSKLIGQEVSFDKAKEASGILSLTLETEIQSAKLSPDATAIAIATSDGNVTSYIIDDDQIRFANRIRPLPNPVEEMIFLDNLHFHSQEPFWKHLVLSSDSGRRLAIYDYDSWECLAKLRFEIPDQINRLELLAEPTSQFLFIVDYDFSNLFCLELGTLSSLPCFLACTMITFANPLICISSPILSDDQENSRSELDDLDDDTSSISNQGTCNVMFTALTHRSLIDLTVELERIFIDSSVLNAKRNNILSGDSDLVVPSQPSNPSLELISDADAHVKRYGDHTTSTNSNVAHSTNGFSNAYAELVEQKFEEVSERMAELSNQIIKLQEENADMRKEQNIQFSGLFTNISNELKTHEERIEAKMAKSNAELIGDLAQHINTQLNNHCSQILKSIDSTQTSTLEAVQTRVGQNVDRIIVPTIERICAQLLQQLNESFSLGLSQFLDQMKELLVPRVQNDLQVLSQLLETEEFTKAFEVALLRNDLATLIFVCSKVNPEKYFTTISNSVMLTKMLQVLPQSLEKDTDLKLRYILNILLALNTPEQNKKIQPGQLDSLRQAIKNFVSTDINGQYQLQTRTIDQLILNLLGRSPY